FRRARVRARRGRSRAGEPRLPRSRASRQRSAGRRDGASHRALVEGPLGPRHRSSAARGPGALHATRRGADQNMTMAAPMVPPTPRFEHTSVMLGEVLDAIAPCAGGVYLDVTAGGGGHSHALLERAPEARLIAFDRDPSAVLAAKRRLAPFGERA